MSRHNDSSVLKQMRPVDINKALDNVFADNPELLKKLQSNYNLVNFVVGLAMKSLNGGADPSVIKRKVEDRIQERLNHE